MSFPKPGEEVILKHSEGGRRMVVHEVKDGLIFERVEPSQQKYVSGRKKQAIVRVEKPEHIHVLLGRFEEIDRVFKEKVRLVKAEAKLAYTRALAEYETHDPEEDS